jgi:hypothetical protein
MQSQEALRPESETVPSFPRLARDAAAPIPVELTREEAARPTQEPPGSEAKLLILEARRRFGLPLFNPDDARQTLTTRSWLCRSRPCRVSFPEAA